MKFTTSLLPVFLLVSIAHAQPAPIAPQDATRHMRLPEGFQATLFAGEPDVVQPIALAFDDRGRLWVAECLSYPKWSDEPTDRVTIFEDTNGDGRFDRKKLFYQGANLTGLNIGFGGVWLCSLPNLLFIPDRDRDDVPDGPPQVLLDGWNLECKHNVFNSLTWGPDGWLYGCNGITVTSQVGKPGTPAQKRVPFNCGVWRYHPTRHEFEPVAWGTTNPFGLDFDDYGEMFITNCVIKHLWHVIPGAHFQRMYGEDFNRHTYRLMESCADHIHWAGGPWQQARGGAEHSDHGGGHAHAGCAIYLGDNWPAEYRNRLFTCNIHGNRVNQDLLQQHGSGYIGQHRDDFLHAGDPWFRGIALACGPDGSVYVTDWCDTGECHDYEDIHRENGRIYKITHGQPRPYQRDLAAASNEELVELQSHANDWLVRHARRLLQERLAGKPRDEASRTARRSLIGQVRRIDDTPKALRALWALYSIDGLSPRHIDQLLSDPRPHLRAWAVRLELNDRAASEERLAQLTAMAKSEPSSVVRLALASGLQRLPLENRWEIAAGLLSHLRDADDQNLPLMLWYGIEPLAGSDPNRALTLLRAMRIPLVRQLTARRVAEATTSLPLLVTLLGKLDDTEATHNLLRGMQQALEGRRNLSMPDGWRETASRLVQRKRPDVRELAWELSLVFGDRAAITELERRLQDASALAADRQQAVRLLAQHKAGTALPGKLHALLAEPALRSAALRGLAAFDSAQTPAAIFKHYSAFNEDEKQDAIATLASRPAYALALIEAIEQNRIPRRDMTNFTVRQLLAMKNREVEERFKQVWGAVRSTSADKAAEIARYKKLLTPAALKEADRSQGRLVYQRTCAACHKLFDAGGAIGPEITGSQRTNLDYVLENLLDPSALVGRDYQMWVIETADGRVINGIVVSETGDVLAVQTQNERIVLQKSEIAQREQSRLSLMPEGQLARLSDTELRDLVAYLAGPGQSPLPAASDDAKLPEQSSKDR